MAYSLAGTRRHRIRAKSSSACGETALLVSERLGGPDPRGPESWSECCRHRHEVDDQEDQSQVAPGDDEAQVLPARLVARVDDDLVREDEPECGADHDRGQR